MTEPYTPTTEAIRNVHLPSESRAAFDRWLSDHDHEVHDAALVELGRMLGDVTRVTVVHPVRRREYERHDFDGVALSIQDDGRTLKVLPASMFAQEPADV